MTDERDALRDLTSGLGWEYFERHVITDLTDRRTQLIANAGTMDPQAAGLAVREYAALEAWARAVLRWPANRVQTLEKNRSQTQGRPH